MECSRPQRERERWSVRDPSSAHASAAAHSNDSPMCLMITPAWRVCTVDAAVLAFWAPGPWLAAREREPFNPEPRTATLPRSAHAPRQRTRTTLSEYALPNALDDHARLAGVHCGRRWFLGTAREREIASHARRDPPPQRSDATTAESNDSFGMCTPQRA
jgi:hypothetical protein